MASSTFVWGVAMPRGKSNASYDPSLSSSALSVGKTPRRSPPIEGRGVMQHGQGFAIPFLASQGSITITADSPARRGSGKESSLVPSLAQVSAAILGYLEPAMN